MSAKRNPLHTLRAAKWILTCEHAGNKIPADWKEYVKIPKEILNSHEGIDIGAKHLSETLSKKLHLPLFLHEESRLLIELNRSIHHPKLFSRFSNTLDSEKKDTLIKTIYRPHWQKVENHIQEVITEYECPVVHIGVHSFTPELNGTIRTCDIGLLYDPKSANEKELCELWKRALSPYPYRVRKNYPYLGISDSLTTHLRGHFGVNRYIGIELEVNQALLQTDPQRVEKAIVHSVQEIFSYLQ